ncbi:MAG: ABC transporter permease subunit [Hespellia sp.]|nr:ABC transporter permease subunit [Hespellia sp.]
MVLFWHECKMNGKTLVIWSCCVGLLNCGCLLLFESLSESMEQMSEAYAQMGSFSTALGLDRLSVSTMEGFYATEISLIFALGGAMFAAMIGASMLSKEEEGHTVEFLYALPFGRNYIVRWKYFTMVVLTFVFQLICMLGERAGFAVAGEMPPVQEYMLFHEAQFLMHLEIGSICFLVSSRCKRRQIGMALGLAVLFYLADMMCRVIPDLENLKYITPYYYSNAVDIFTSGNVSGTMLMVGIGVTAGMALLAMWGYERRDLSV